MDKISKLIIAIGVLIIIVALHYHFNIGGFDSPGKLEAKRQDAGIYKHELLPLLDKQKPLSSLAKAGYYTVVIGYVDSCVLCKEFETSFAMFLSKRPDVVIHLVRFPEGDVEKWATKPGNKEELKQRIKSYNFCIAPHIEIYDADRQLIAADTCSKRSGTAFFEHWVNAEFDSDHGVFLQ